MKNFFLAPLAAFAGLLLLTPAPAARAQASTGPGASAAGTFVIKALNVATPKTPEFTTVGGETNSKRATLGVWMEMEVEFSATAPAQEVVFHFDFAINGKLLTGEQTLQDVQPGQSLFTSCYVAPRVLTALLKGQPVTVNTLQNARVQILRPGVSAPLATKFLKEGGATFFSTAQQMPNMILLKSQTPFASLWWDRYETVKPPTAR